MRKAWTHSRWDSARRRCTELRIHQTACSYARIFLLSCSRDRYTLFKARVVGPGESEPKVDSDVDTLALNPDVVAPIRKEQCLTHRVHWPPLPAGSLRRGLPADWPRQGPVCASKSEENLSLDLKRDANVNAVREGGFDYVVERRRGLGGLEDRVTSNAPTCSCPLAGLAKTHPNQKSWRLRR